MDGPLMIKLKLESGRQFVSDFACVSEEFLLEVLLRPISVGVS